MATTGEVFSTATITTAAESPWDDRNWSGLDNHKTDDGNYTGPVFETTGQKSYVAYIKGFDLSGIPSNAVIDGVTVRIEARAYYDQSEIGLVQLLDASGARVGTNQASTPVGVTTTDTVYSFGGAADLWGNSITAAWVRDADFGVAVAFTNTGSGAEISYIDYITVEITYHIPQPRTYYVVYESSATDPADNSTGYGQIIAGQDGSGAAAVASGSIVAPTADALDEALATITGLSASTTYRAAAVWWDAASDYGAGRILSAGITTSAPAGPPTLTGISASGISASGATLTITAS